MKIPYARIFAWIVVGLIVSAAHTAYRHYSNPWKPPVSPVIERLPPAAPGCSDDCKK